MHGERPVHKLLAKALLASAASLLLLATPAMAKDSGAVRMQRLYNPKSGEHFYTANTNERDHLVNLGWSYEGVGWVAPSKSRIPVYRLYNPNAGDHHYTMNAAERDMLVKVGWNYEGVGWYSSEAQTVSLYRQYNPNAKTGTHNYTTSGGERNYLVNVGWRDEGIGWYGVDPSLAPVDDFDHDTGYAVIEARMTLRGSGTGYHAKVDIACNGHRGVASFGIQYEHNMRYAHKGPGGTNSTAFLLENVMDHAAEAGLEGKSYTFIQNAQLGQSYLIRLSWHKDTNTLHCYVNNEEVFSQKTTFQPPFTFAVEGSVERNGDSISASFDHVKVKAGDGKQAYGYQTDDFGTIGYWNDSNDFFGLQAKLTNPGYAVNVDGPTRSNAFDASMTVTGTARLDPRYDWDTCFQLVEPTTGSKNRPLSGMVNIAQTQ